MIDLADACVEAPHTSEARRERDLIHGQARLVDQLFREVQTPRLRDRNRRRSQMPQKQSPQMP